MKFKYLVITLILTGACQGPTQDQKDSSDSETTALPKITVAEVSVSDSSFNAPETLATGYVTIHFTNSARDLHSAHLIKLEYGHGVDELITAYAEAINTTSTRPSWMKHRGGVIAEPGTGELTLNLEPGNYAWVCVMGEDSEEGSHFTGYEMQALTVSGSTDQADLPAPDAVIYMNDDKNVLSTALTPGERSVDIINNGSKEHLVAISKLIPGATEEEVIAWFSTFDGPPPAIGLAATTAMAPGYSARLHVTLDTGRYVLFCYANAEGVPHLAGGAIDTFTVK